MLYVVTLWTCWCFCTILLTITTVAQNEVALGYHRLRGLYFLAVVFAATISVSTYSYHHHHENHHSYTDKRKGDNQKRTAMTIHYTLYNHTEK